MSVDSISSRAIRVGRVVLDLKKRRHAVLSTRSNASGVFLDLAVHGRSDGVRWRPGLFPFRTVWSEPARIKWPD